MTFGLAGYKHKFQSLVRTSMWFFKCYFFQEVESNRELIKIFPKIGEVKLADNGVAQAAVLLLTSENGTHKLGREHTMATRNDQSRKKTVKRALLTFEQKSKLFDLTIG